MAAPVGVYFLIRNAYLLSMNEYSLLLVDWISSGAISLPLILYWDILGSDHVRRRGGEFGSFEWEAKPAEFTLFVIALPG